MLTGAAKTQFIAAMRRMFRPVVRQLIARGVTFPAISQVLKQLYVDVAENDFHLGFKRQTDSRLALVTGINRKEIGALRKRKTKSDEMVEAEDSLLTHVIGRWMTTPYARDGVPIELPYEAAQADAPSFAGLVRGLRSDIPTRAVLDELLRQKAVDLRGDGRVRLVREAHVPTSGEEGKFAILGSDPAELFKTIARNIENPEDPLLQRKVVYDNIGAEALVDLRASGRNLGERFIRDANELIASKDRDRNPDAPGGLRTRVAFGIYFFEEPFEGEGKPTSPPSGAPPGRIRRRQ